VEVIQQLSKDGGQNWENADQAMFFTDGNQHSDYGLMRRIGEITGR